MKYYILVILATDKEDKVSMDTGLFKAENSAEAEHKAQILHKSFMKSFPDKAKIAIRYQEAKRLDDLYEKFIQESLAETENKYLN